MVFISGVPIHGNLWLLLALSPLFLVCPLGLGLLVSMFSSTQFQAMQFALILTLPSVPLSGFVFPRSEMPAPIYLASFAIPVTYYVEILRPLRAGGALHASRTSLPPFWHPAPAERPYLRTWRR